MFCPKCGKTIEDYSNIDGGWCSKCKEYYPADILRDAMEEELEVQNE